MRPTVFLLVAALTFALYVIVHVRHIRHTSRKKRRKEWALFMAGLPLFVVAVLTQVWPAPARDYMELHRPRLEARVIDSGGVSGTRQAFEVRNTGRLTAARLQRAIYSSAVVAIQGDSLPRRDLGPGDTMLLPFPPTAKNPSPLILRLFYDAVVDGDSHAFTSSYRFALPSEPAAIEVLPIATRHEHGRPPFDEESRSARMHLHLDKNEGMLALTFTVADQHPHAPSMLMRGTHRSVHYDPRLRSVIYEFANRGLTHQRVGMPLAPGDDKAMHLIVLEWDPERVSLRVDGREKTAAVFDATFPAPR